MNKNLSEQEWLSEFDQFISAEQMDVPAKVSEKILLDTKRKMNPSAWTVFFKLLGIHSVFGTLSLGVCNQFGLNPFKTQLSLSDYFMTFGHSACMALCGVMFVGLSVFAAWLALNRDEFRILKKNYVIQMVSLSFLSLATFVALGADVTVGLGFLWLAGALLGGAIPTWALANKSLRLA